MALQDLEILGQNLKKRFLETFNDADRVLPEAFKSNITQFDSSPIDYKQYNFIVKSSSGLNIYFPNQAIYIAAYFADYYVELEKYRNLLLKLSIDKEDIKQCRGNKTLAESLIKDKLLEEKDKELLIRFLSDYNWWKGGKTIDRADYYVSPILSLGNLVNASQGFVADICRNLSNNITALNILKSEIDRIEESIIIHNLPRSAKSEQIIYYGAPGTGKSHAIEVATEGQDVIRTTFHPDSDYSTFVGAYKPTTKEIPMRDVTGKVIIENGKQVTENRIVYEFVSQAFLQAYVGAWEKFAANGDQPQPQYLVIEEINRGNCAQIFGDLFQLLDRNASGFSEYPIKADADMKKQLNKLLAGLNIDNAEAINALYKGKDVVSQVLDGDVLLLPSNLYIWATMNTSDQSLFPIDSAFKRRWDWRYVRIDDAHKGWKIEANGKRYDWWNFLERVNKLIGETTSSEDKKLGYFFCKTSDGIITAETFVSKVVFYLWNDVFKDYEFEGDIFVDEDKTSKLSFDKFYITDAVGQTVVNEAKVVVFLTNLGVEFDKPEGISDENGENDDEADVTDDGYKESINRIEFPDGTAITTENLTQFDAFIEAMKKIGLEKVFTVADKLKYQRRNCPMLSLEKFEAIENDPGYSYVQVDNYYFVKGAKSYTYVRIIEDLSKMLDLNISVICKKPE